MKPAPTCETERRDRSQTTDFEKRLQYYRAIIQSRHAETMRVVELIEMALYAAESDEAQQLLVDLAHKVLKP
ncbi:MAG: hypothetical protein ACK4ZW_06040 [Blastomonas sp.]